MRIDRSDRASQGALGTISERLRLADEFCDRYPAAVPVALQRYRLGYRHPIVAPSGPLGQQLVQRHTDL